MNDLFLLLNTRRIGWHISDVCTNHSGVSRILFRGGLKIFLEKWGFCMAPRARGEATRLLGGFGGMLPQENF